MRTVLLLSLFVFALVSIVASFDDEPTREFGSGARVAEVLVPHTASPSPNDHALTGLAFELVKYQPRPRRKPVRHAQEAAAGVWDRLAACESGGNWQARTGRYEGGLQFLNSTWLKAGGGQYARHAYDATREQQIEIAASWLERTSWDQWPVCSRVVGAR